jgi:hypothetical protein
MDNKNEVLDVIISLIKGAKEERSRLMCEYEGKTYTLWGCSYLLDQALRTYEIPANHYLITKEAQETWNKITSKKIGDYHYQDAVTYEGDEPITLQRYTGNGNAHKKKSLQHGDTFHYREIFHDDHVVPLKVIIEDLCALPTLDYQSVLNVLDKIYICRMMKEEGRGLHNKTQRCDDYLTIINGLYKEKGLEVIGF